ncbi:hypothetical protein RhiJN_19981 [Ceratobasidium sp. AG-Ba]|nr:hypothetical protein RhiJN_19981 [Ceratobasidium sp. AG-Ba]
MTYAGNEGDWACLDFFMYLPSSASPAVSTSVSISVPISTIGPTTVFAPITTFEPATTFRSTSTSTSTSTSNQSAISSPDSSSSKSTPVGAIAGSTAGGLAVIALLIVAALVYRKRQHRTRPTLKFGITWFPSRPTDHECAPPSSKLRLSV